MTPFFINHLWQSTVFAALAGLLAVALRRLPARVRFWVWMSASLKFLVPFALLAALGSHLPWRIAVPTAQPHALAVLAQPFPPADLGFVAALPGGPVVQAPTAPLPLVVTAIWLSGFLWVLGYWIIRWRQVSEAIRSAIPFPDGLAGFPAPVLLTEATIEPGVFGVFRQVLLLPRGIADRLSDEQLQSVAAHERRHIQRRDNLWSLLHMLVEAVFWFHPLIWWIGGRLIAERERACDESVLQDGADDEIYAQSILRVCRYYTGMPVACVSGMAGSDLTKRIAAIMSYDFVDKLSRTVRVGLACLAVATVATPVVVGMMNASSLRAQSGSSPVLRFEVASIKPYDPAASGRAAELHSIFGDNPCAGGVPSIGPGRFTVANITLYRLVVMAYGARNCRLSTASGLISGGGEWVKSDAFDIQAVIPQGSPSFTFAQPTHVVAPELKMMIQQLLADRFKLAIHRETTQMQFFNLVVVKPGKIKSSDEQTQPADIPLSDIPLKRDGSGLPRGFMLTNSRGLTANAISISNLTGWLQTARGRIVIDKTGIKGLFDIHPQLDVDLSVDSIRLESVEIASRVLEQLGLKLESTKGAVEVIVIDHVEKPIPN